MHMKPRLHCAVTDLLPPISYHVGSVCVCINLFLQVRLSEGEQELLHVFGSQTVDAARVDGPAQELVHLVLRV